MKYLGLLCMAAAAVAGGFLLAGEWEMRVKMLGIFRQMAVYLKARILYSNETLPEALKEIGSRFSDGNSGMAAEAGLFFLRVEKRMEEEAGKPFAEIWKEEMEKFPDDLPLRKQDLEALQALGENLGYADKKTQERTILFYLEQADDSLAFLKKEMESRTKLYRSLGMAAGLFFLVLFSVNLIFKIAAVGILVSVMCQVLKHSGREDQAFLTSLAGLILVLFWIVPYIYDLFETIKNLFSL